MAETNGSQKEVMGREADVTGRGPRWSSLNFCFTDSLVSNMLGLRI